MVPLKSSMGEISSKISSRPDGEDRSVRPSASAAATRACQVSFPTSQSKLSTCSASRSGTSRGSEILAKEMRREPETSVILSDWGLREATKGRPSTGSQKSLRCWERMPNRPSQVLSRTRVGSKAAQSNRLPDQGKPVQCGPTLCRPTTHSVKDRPGFSSGNHPRAARSVCPESQRDYSPAISWTSHWPPFPTIVNLVQVLVDPRLTVRDRAGGGPVDEDAQRDA